MTEDERLEALVTALRWIQEEAVEALDALANGNPEGADRLQNIYDRCSYELERVREKD